MLNLKIENKEFLFPSGWDEVTLKNYIDILNSAEDKNSSSIEVFIKTLSLLCNNPEFSKIAININVDDFKKIQDSFKWMNVEPKTSKVPVTSFKIDDEEWTIKKDFTKLTVGESISIETMLKDKQAFDLTPTEIAFGVLFRRILPDGNIEPFNPDNINLIINEKSKFIMITDVYDIISFFLLGEKKPSNNSVEFSTSKIKMKNKKSSQQKMETK